MPAWTAMPTTIAPLRDRDFRLYIAGEALSSVGSGLHLVLAVLAPRLRSLPQAVPEGG
jgi:hypothetical protein